MWSTRGAPGWRKWCSTTGNRFPMRKSATVPFSRRCEPALASLVPQARLVLHVQMCTTRYSRSSMNALQHEDGGSGSMRRPHGRPLSHTRPGRHRRHGGGALLVRENTIIACAACGAALRYLTGDAAVLGNEGSGWLQVDSGNPRRPGHATRTCLPHRAPFPTLERC